MRRLYSPNLINKWKKALKESFGYKEYMDMVIQPTFTKKYLSYVPFLNYTDRSSDDIEDLLELGKDNSYQIRTLNFDYKDFRDFDPVTMRLDIRGKSYEEIKKGYKKLAKRHINKEDRLKRYTITTNSHLTPAETMELFYSILQDIFQKHGTPLFPKEFLKNLCRTLEDIDIFFIYENEKVIGGIMFFYDNKIATLQYGGIMERYKNHSCGYALYDGAIRHILRHKDVEIIDFGRSPYNQGTYFFKSRFNAQPIKIDIHSSDKKNIYSSYKLASQIWKRLPTWLTSLLGPPLTKYLVDL